MNALRNLAIIAHVDHGKTTLVGEMLRQSGMFRSGELDKLAGGQHGLIMDSNPLERERGITILSKNCAVMYASESGERTRINIIDTPGHADFGGEVERVLRMADAALLLVDAFEGPMPQTRFVLQKALESKLRLIVVINKCDRPNARADEVAGEVFDLLIELGADDHTLDFPLVYASARDGWASMDLDHESKDLRPLFETILREAPVAGGDESAPLQMLVTTLDFSEYVGRIGIGRVFNGVIRRGQRVALLKRDGSRMMSKIGGLQRFEGLGRVDAEEVGAGDLCAVIGVEGVDIGDTIADPENSTALPKVAVDEPTITMTFRVNDSPFAGREGEFVTSRQIKARLEKELEHNVALRVEPSEGADEYIVSGRGLLHLGVLIETMRREGFELAVGKPQVIIKEIDGRKHEPIERVVVDCPDAFVGPAMELLGARRGELKHMDSKRGVTRMEFEIPSRGLIGVRSRLLTATQGEAIMHASFLRYAPSPGEPPRRQAGVLISTEQGKATAYAIENLSDRGVMLIEPGQAVYPGMIVGEHNRENDLPVNITCEKKLTNIRAASKDATVVLKPPRRMSLEASLEYIEEDELVEVTPGSLRLRKRLLNEADRRRADRSARDRATATS
jgi:GTP-binding protein